MRKVKNARLHSTDTFIDGFGNLGSAVPGSITGLVMTIDETFLYLNLRGTEALIPLANVKSVVLAPEDKPKAK